MDWTQIISNLGLPVAIIIAGGLYINKHTPNFIKAWHEFTMSLRDLSTTVAQSSAITQKHYDETITVQDHLKKAIALLEEHHANAVIIQEDMGELRKLFVELAEKIQTMPGGQ